MSAADHGSNNSKTSVCGVRVTHPDRVLYPDQGATKRELMEYYRKVAKRILPHVAGRALSVVRCPKGRKGECFFQKHTGQGMPDSIRSVTIREKQGRGRYICIEDVAGLIGLVQMGVLEIHPWGSGVDHLEEPDRVIFDMDPGPGAAWSAVVEAARRMRGLLEDVRLGSYVRATGGKGLHVVAPLRPTASWDDVSTFARSMAERLVETNREKYVIHARKSERKGKIFVDYLRNSRGATAVACYSTRAKPGAPIATPLRWDELGRVPGASHYTLSNIARRLNSLRDDPWAGYHKTRQTLTASRLRSATQ